MAEELTKEQKYQRAYAKLHSTKIKEQHRAYQKAHPKEKAESARRWYEKHCDEVKERMRVYYKAHTEEAKVRAKEWIESHPERHADFTNQWRRNNPEAEQAIKHTRRAKEKGCSGKHTAEEWIALRDSTGGVCPRCQIYVGVKNMTRDHIIPLSRGGSNYIDNIQPLCGIKANSCNSHKWAKTMDYRENICGINKEGIQ